MARTTMETAKIIVAIHDDFFGNDFAEKFRITWERMREICDVRKLSKNYLGELVDELNELGFSLATFDEYLLVLKESDCAELRSVPGRIVEKYLPDTEEIDSEELEEESDDVEWEDE